MMLRRRIASMFQLIATSVFASLLCFATPETSVAGDNNAKPASRETAVASASQTLNPPSGELSSRTSARYNREIKSSIEAWQARVRTKVAAIEKLALDLDMKKIKSQRLAASELQDILADLDDEAVAIIEAYEALGPDLELYRRALQAASPSFARISVDLEKAAMQKRSPMLQQTYADFATQARKLASHYAEQAKGIASMEIEVEEKIGFVRESREFFIDVRKLLDAIPADSGFATERLVDRMNQYIDVFQTAMDAMRGVGDKISVKKGSTSSPIKPTQSTATTSETSKIDPFAAIGRR